MSNAFLHGFLAKEVFIKQPQGFVDKAHPNFVCKLHKALIGLKQAPQAWFHRLSTFLLDIGFKALLVDSSLFMCHLVVYVDLC